MDNDDDDRWVPRHREQNQINSKKIHSVSEASRIHEAKNITVIGAISGIQPLRKMIKGVSCQCMRCNTTYDRKYDKPEQTESSTPIERIRKCLNCKTGDYLDRFKWENINAVIVELKNHETFSEIDPLRIIVFGDDEPAFDNTIDIEKHIGETIIVTGDIYPVDLGRNRFDSKVVSYLYVKYLVKYLSKQELRLSSDDVKAIKRFVNREGDNILDTLAKMFATRVIGYNHVKKGLLLCAVSTSIDLKTKKIHSLLVGDPGLAKSQLLEESAKLVPNSKFVNVQYATGKSLTAIVSKEENDAIVLRIGPIPRAKGAIAATNEIARMNPADQGLMLDIMQEQGFSTNKYGREFHVDAPTVIIASANPIGGSWKPGYDDNGKNDDDKIDLNKIPTITPLLNRFDLIFSFKNTRDEDMITDYAYKKSDMEDRPVSDYTAYISRHIMYAKQLPKPKFSEEAKVLLNQYYIKIAVKHGSPRIRETIYKIAENISRIKLKNVVDLVDANDTMKFYNVVMQQMDMMITLPSNPRDTAYEECVAVLSGSNFPILDEEIFRIACERNPHVDRYLNGSNKSLKLRNNAKLRPILEMLLRHNHIKAVQNRPMVLQYIHTQSMVKADKQACDQCDVCDDGPNTPAKNLGINDTHKIISRAHTDGSHTSHTSHYASDIPNSPPFRCYLCEKEGIIFEASNEKEYQRHGALKHPKNPLLYPSVAEIEKYELAPQGKSWEK